MGKHGAKSTIDIVHRMREGVILNASLSVFRIADLTAGVKYIIANAFLPAHFRVSPRIASTGTDRRASSSDSISGASNRLSHTFVLTFDRVPITMSLVLLIGKGF